MKKGGQKAKSNKHEKEIAKIFTAAWFDLGEGEFRRVPMSGGWDKRVAPGDIIPIKVVSATSSGATDGIIDKKFPFSIECKNWRDENVKHFFTDLYTKNDCQIFDWIRQAHEAALPSRKVPIVVFKLFRAENIAIIHYSDWSKMCEFFGSIKRPLYMLKKITDNSFVEFNLVFCLLKDWVEWVDWEHYKIKRNYIRSIVHT